MVAMLGAIMPDPFATPPIVTVLPPKVNLTAASFAKVSVVMIASAVSSFPSLLSLPANSLIAGDTLSIGIY